MKLSDIMGHANLATYAEVALVLFVLAFVLQLLRTWAPSQQGVLEAARQMPLDDPNDRLALGQAPPSLAAAPTGAASRPE